MGHVVHVGEKKCVQVVWWGNRKEITTRKTQAQMGAY
jgi:hypothetical protein